MSVQVDWDFSDDDRAKAEIAAAVRYLLKDSAGSAHGDTVQEILAIVRDVAAGSLPPGAGAVTPPAMSGIIYKAYVIDAFQRDTDKWRATIRRLNGKKIRVAVPPAVLDEVTTSADALTAEKAVELAKRSIDLGGLT